MTDSTFEFDVVVVGAGLSGLTCAKLLQSTGLIVVVLEAANRVGGRIHSVTSKDCNTCVADLGPTWVWPQYQPVIRQWLDRLDIKTFDQYDSGNTVFDFGDGKAVQYHRAPGQDGISRISGGPQALVDAVFKELSSGTVRTNHRVEHVSLADEKISVKVGGKLFLANQVVMAVPLRVACQNIKWPDGFSPLILQQMKSIPTWMSTQAKMVALYDQPFWRGNGLNGRVVSQAGPMVEVHDHCSVDDGQAALFGFIGWPHDLRQKHPEQLRTEIVAQLVRCFGDEAGRPVDLIIEDWAVNCDICSAQDRSTAPTHPDIISDIFRQGHCDERLFFTVAETALQSPGLIEGAFAAAEAAAEKVLRLSAAR